VPSVAPASKYEWWSTERAIRIVVAIAGGWLLTDLFVAWVSLLLVMFGMEKAEAVVLLPSLGFLIYLGILIWAFAVHSLRRLCTVVSLGIVLSYGLARLLMAMLEPSAAV